MLAMTITAVFCCVALSTGSLLYFMLSRKSDLHKRLERLMDSSASVSLTLRPEATPVQRFVARLGHGLHASDKDRRRLTAAGFPKDSLPIFLGSKLILASLLPLLLMLFIGLPKGGGFDIQMFLYATLLGILGFLLPRYWLNLLVKARTTKIFHTLPDVLDLLTVCLEAGMGIDAALLRVSDNPQFQGNPLAQELLTAGREAKAGKPRHAALKDMADRTGVEDISSFVALIVQTERFGTSLSRALRVHGEALRTKRRQIAEEAAAKTSVKMLFPLVFFVFPALMVVVIAPAAFLLQDIFK